MGGSGRSGEERVRGNGNEDGEAVGTEVDMCLGGMVELCSVELRSVELYSVEL
jgi:hypothetical protein